MLHVLLSLMRDRIQMALTKEDGAVAFEYLLVVGGVSVAIVFLIAAAAPSLMAETIYGTCLAMQTVIDTITCTDPTP